MKNLNILIQFFHGKKTIEDVERGLRAGSSNQSRDLRDAALAFAAECERGVDYDGVGGPNPFIATLKTLY